MKVLIAVSGALGLSTLEILERNIAICGVLTDKNSSGIISYCQQKQIPVFVGNPRKQNFLENVRAQLKEIDLLFSINYLFLFSQDFLKLPKLYSLNIHGSLLPKYRGRTPHVWAIINGEEKVGITVHKIDEGCDTGDILLQESIEINNETTGGEILVFYSELYPKLVLQAIGLVQSKTEKFITQNHNEASYFPKRSPEDGQIDWNWSGKRIYNWVRAMTRPYPGAFAFLENKKIIIWKVDVIDEPICSIEIGESFVQDGKLYFRCKDCFILIVEYERE